MAADRQRANRRTAGWLAVAAIAMVGFGYALVPLYEVFCEATGLGGRTGRLSAAEMDHLETEAESDLRVTVFFDANTRGLPWDFSPEVGKVSVQPGRLNEVFYLGEKFIR